MPDKLYCKGKLPDEGRRTAAIVGARECNEYGRRQAYQFAFALASAGVQIISGMAKGVDTWAHKGALDAGMDTYAVLGCGVDICYPAQNRQLYEKIQEKGGVLSQFDEGTPPIPKNFPIRNGIISGLADLVLVVQAREKSGSLITAGLALEQGKTVYAVPGRVDEMLSKGCNYLIYDGAGIAYTVDAVLEELGLSGCDKKEINSQLKGKKDLGLATKEKIVYSCLDLQPKSLNRILTEVNIKQPEIIEILLMLELKGLIYESGKNYYAKVGG